MERAFSVLEETQNTAADINETIENAAEEHMGRKKSTPKKPWISESTLHLIEAKHVAMGGGDAEDYKQKKKKAAETACKADWKKWVLELTSGGLDLRDRWLGIRGHRKTITP